MDIWSIGCIFAELLGRRVLFQGKASTEQVELIIQVLGTPKIDEIYKKGRDKSREIIFKFGPLEKTEWIELFPDAGTEALDLLENMLKFDPDKRISIEKALKHKYFAAMPEYQDEVPNKVTEFDFEFETQDLDTKELRELILYEILLYHEDPIYDEYERKKSKFLTKLNKKKNGTTTKK